MNTDITNTLLTKIHNYYPIGRPEMYQQYAGFQELKNIMTQKIAEMENNESKWNQFIKTVRNKFPLCRVEDLYYPFPSFCLNIHIGEKTFETIKTQTSVQVVVSLLADYYTIYFGEHSTYTAYLQSNPMFGILAFDSYSMNSQDKDLIDHIQEAMPLFFPNHKYLSHFFLMKNGIIGGNPLSDIDNFSIQREVSYFEYLFNFNSYGNFSVIA